MSYLEQDGEHLVRRGLRAIGRAIVPVVCPGCGLPDSPWCEECAAPWWERPWRSESWAAGLDYGEAAVLPVWSVAPLDGSARHMISAWKDGGRRDLDPFFFGAAARAAAAVGPAFPPAVSVVPVPSRPRSVRSRGIDLPGLVAHGVLEGLRESRATSIAHGPSLVGARAEVLLVNRGREARGMGVRGRRENARSGIRWAGHRPAVRIAVLVDDVMTTGASLAAATDVLEANGVAVIGAITLAARAPANPGPPSLG